MRRLIVCLVLILICGGANAQPPSPALVLGRGEIVSAAWSPDGESIWISTTGGTWQLDAELREIAAYPISHAALSPDGTLLAGASQSGHMPMLNIATGEEVGWSPEARLQNLEPPLWSPDGRWLAIIHERAIILKDVHGDANKSIYFTAQLLAWSASGRYLAGFSPENYESTVWVYEVDSERFILPEDGHLAFDLGVSHLKWVGDDELHWSSAGDGGQRLRWAIPSGKNQKTTTSACSYYGCEHSPDNRFIASAGLVELQVRDAVSGEPTFSRNGGFFGALAWTPDSSRLAVSEADWRDHSTLAVIVFDPADDAQIWRQEAIGFPVERLMWNPDGMLLAVGMGRIALLDGKTGAILHRSEDFRTPDFIVLDGSGARLAVSDTFGDVQIVAIETGETRTQATGSTFSVTKMLWQPHGNIVAFIDSRSRRIGSAAQVMLAFDGIESLPSDLAKIADAFAGGLDIAWSADGSTLAVAHTLSIRLYGAREEEIAITLPSFNTAASYYISAVRWTPAGEPVAQYTICCHSPPIMENLDTGLQISTRYTAWAIAPDGSLVSINPPPYFGDSTQYEVTLSVVSESDRQETLLAEANATMARYWLSPSTSFAAGVNSAGNGLIWDTETATPRNFLTNVAELYWSPDDATLAILQRDGQVWLKNADSLRRLWLPPLPPARPGMIAWSGDGRTLALSQDGIVRVWRVE